MAEIHSPIELRPSALIRPSSDGSWEPDETGFEALLLPVRGIDGTVIDTAAWEIGHPQVWWLRRNIATFVGEHELILASREKRPVRLVATPKEYLAHWGRAICILNWRSDVRSILAGAEAGILCESRAVAARAQGAMNSRVRIIMTAAA